MRDDVVELAGNAGPLRIVRQPGRGSRGVTIGRGDLTLADVLKTTVFVASAERDDLAAAWDVVSVAFGDHDTPSTLLGVTVLGWPGQLVETEAVAVVTAVG